jgi:dihydropteroate synthase
MLTLKGLAELADRYQDDLGNDVAAVDIDDVVIATNDFPAIMGTLNLSRDSTYRESIGVSTDSAIRKARTMMAQGADIVDIGAESTTAKAARVSASDQIARLVPVIEGAVDAGVLVSAETYEPAVVRACLEAGARILNLTGAEHHEEIYRLAAEFDATVIMCYVGGANVREISDVNIADDPIPGLLEYFTARVAQARSMGVGRLVIDPGMGFYYGNLVDPQTRVQHQTRVILQSFRLRRLGLPICQALPHAFDIFEDQYRTAEGFFAVLAQLGGVSIWRTHEVAQVRAVREATQILSTE